MQWATRANEAYRTLKSPLKRAAYMCERAGALIDAESSLRRCLPNPDATAAGGREALEEARANLDGAGLRLRRRS